MIIQESQSLIDAAIIECGSADAAFEVAILNNMSITDDLAIGFQLVPTNILDNGIYNYYKSKGLQPATGITNAEINDILEAGDGIEFWGIEIDFEVQ